MGGLDQHLRADLADLLLNSGVVHDSRWLRAFRDVPRHEFLPWFHRQGSDGTWERLDRRSPDWLTLVYSDRVWVTQFDGDDAAAQGIPTCSSSMPTIMAIMLEALDVHNGQSVLEIGTGTGYNAALLSHVLGDDHVTSVDVDVGVLTRAREHLRRTGYKPTCVVGDGALGHPERAPYDRLLATCAVARIPVPWLEQVRPGGLVVTTLHRQIGAGLVRIVSGGDGTGEGRVLVEDGRFMPLRAHDRQVSLGKTDAAGRRPTKVDAEVVIDPASPFEFYGGLALTGVSAGHDRHGSVWFAHPDGSWARVRAGEHSSYVEQGGPRRLWDLVETAYEDWVSLGRPRRHRFGISVSPTEQYLWLDRPDAGRRWFL